MRSYIRVSIRDDTLYAVKTLRETLEGFSIILGAYFENLFEHRILPSSTEALLHTIQHTHNAVVTLYTTYSTRCYYYYYYYNLRLSQSTLILFSKRSNSDCCRTPVGARRFGRVRGDIMIHRMRTITVAPRALATGVKGRSITDLSSNSLLF